MYTLDQLKNKVIWVFREPRSGSSWFIKSLSDQLQRPLYMFHKASNIEQQPRVESSILNTHDFEMLESMGNYNNPIIFRNIRKNKTEQFLSRHISIVLHFDFAKNFNITSHEECNNLPKLTPRVIAQPEILGYIKQQKQIESLWSDYATRYENEAVFYEDLIDKWESKLSTLTFSMNKQISNNTMKMPYNKKEVIVNYDEVDSILKNEFGDY